MLVTDRVTQHVQVRHDVAAWFAATAVAALPPLQTEGYVDWNNRLGPGRQWTGHTERVNIAARAAVAVLDQAAVLPRDQWEPRIRSAVFRVGDAG